MNTNILELNEPSRRDFIGLLARLPLIPAAALRPRPRERETPLAHRMGEGGPKGRVRDAAGRVRDIGENSNPAERAGQSCPDFSFQLSDFKFAPRSFPIAGFRYHDGADALPLLLPGTALTLRAQADNPHDPHAVEILYGALKLGYVPRFCNRHLSQLLQNDVSLTCEVARINADAPPWDAVAVRVSLPQSELLAA